MINTGIIGSDIPSYCIVSKQSMKKAGMILNFQEDTVQIFRLKLNLHVREYGHCALTLCKLQYLLDEDQINSFIKVTLSSNKTLSTEQKGLKLHHLFSSSPPEKLLWLIKKDDFKPQALIMKISQDCQVCKEYY